MKYNPNKKEIKKIIVIITMNAGPISYKFSPIKYTKTSEEILSDKIKKIAFLIFF
jgi:hypothetical protein